MPLEEIDLINLLNAKKLVLELQKKAKETKIKEAKVSFSSAKGKPLLEELVLPSLDELKKKKQSL